MINYTPEQKAVIAHRGKNLLVSAAAGSGKTAVLVERIAGLITDPDHPSSLDRLLVMTFTRAAAEGMRQKIKEALTVKTEEAEEALRAAEIAGDEAKIRELTDLHRHLKVQQSLLVRAHISTIDSYCQGLIRQYFQYLDIDPAFRVADPGELKLLRADLLKEILEEKYEECDPDFLRFSAHFSKNGFDSRISDLVEKAADFADSRPWPAEFLQKNREDLEKEIAEGFDNSPWFTAYMAGIRENAAKLLLKLEAEIAVTNGPDGWKPYLELLTCLRDLYQELSIPGKDYGTVRSLLLGFTAPDLSRKKCAESTPERKEEAKAVINEARTYLKNSLLPDFLVPEDKMAEVSAGSSRDLAVLLGLSENFLLRFAEKKRSRGIVDFSDMEHLALRLLYEKKDGEMVFTSLADSLAKGFDEILIDEYQDSNDVQETLIRALSAERFGRPDVFMVGDIKQSIYSFRDARPELFGEKLAAYETAPGSPEAKSVKICLNQNFRSRPEVIDSVNDLFSVVMKPECGGILYDEDARLYPGRVTQKPETLPNPYDTELLLMEEEAKSEVPEDRSPYTDEELSYLMLARRIRELTEGEGALFAKKDITILLRNGKRAETLVDILGEAGIEASFDSSTGYFSAPEVVTMLSYLAIIDNPRNDIPLAGVLRSSIGGFTDEELSSYRIRFGDRISYYDVLRKAAEESEKAADFLRKLENYRMLSKTLSVHELIYRIYRETGFYDTVSALPGGPKRRKNLDMLLLKAENYCATSYHGLFNFTRYIEQLKKYDTDYGEAPGISEEDVVKITTIHKSKGLEYPVTIVASMDTEFNRMDQRQDLVMDETLGFSCDYVDTEAKLRYPSLKSRLIKERMKVKSLGEELRVLYVAATRARDKLIFAGRMKKASEKPDVGTDLLSCRSELMILEMAGLWENDHVRKRIYDKETLTLGEKEVTLEKAELLGKALASPADREKEAFYRRILQSVYPYQEETELKPKVSVSELKEAKISESEFEFVRDLEEKKAIRGAAFGTLVHRAFEILDYEKEAAECIPDLPGADEDTMKSIRRMIAAFRKTELSSLMEEASKSGTLHREQHFMVGLPARSLSEEKTSEELELLQGIIDAYIEEDDGILLIDYKTDSVETEAALSERYALQLELYAKALSQIFRKEVKRKIIYSTHFAKEIDLV